MVSLEYVAGFVDGEGYLGLARICRRNRSPEYCLRVSIYNSGRAILEEIRGTLGGVMSVVGERWPGWKPAYALIWTNAAAAGLLRKMAPFLRAKAEQAAALLLFNKHIQAGGRSRDRGGRLLPLSSRELKVREAFYKDLKRLNKRGPAGHDHHRRMFLPRNQSRISPKYVAGFIDAEGSLMITKATVADCRTPQYHPRISVANTHRGVLAAIQHTYGGIITH